MDDSRSKGIAFDDEYRIRVLDPHAYGEAERLADECKEFAAKMTKFDEIVRNYVETVETQAARIEREKLTAIGMRNRVRGEREKREWKQRELRGLIAQKKDEHDRLVAQRESLARVEAQQRQLLEKLTTD